jgi:flagellar basal-body rod protein FlgB
MQRCWNTEMSETNNIAALLEAGIRAEGLRQRAIANNMANLETPGYRRISVRFEELFAKALDSGGRFELSEIEPELYQPEQTPVKPNGNDVNLEFEVGQMVKNTLRHRAFVRLLDKQYKQMELAMSVK